MPNTEKTNDDIYDKLEEIRQLLSNQLAAFKQVNLKAIEDSRAEILKLPIRKKIFDLVDNKRTVSQIAQDSFKEELLEKSLPKVSYHIGILEDYNLVSHRDEKGQRFYFKTRE